jgi:hypothetical protein
MSALALLILAGVLLIAGVALIAHWALPATDPARTAVAMPLPLPRRRPSHRVRDYPRTPSTGRDL